MAEPLKTFTEKSGVTVYLVPSRENQLLTVGIWKPPLSRATWKGKLRRSQLESGQCGKHHVIIVTAPETS